MGHVYGYGRVSTLDQSPDLQLDALRAAGSERDFIDKASGKVARRPELDRLLEALLPGDTVVVWKLDRLGRSIKDLIEVVTGLGERGVGFRSLTEAIDTTTAGGRLVFHIFAALAEFEHALIVERTHAGLAAARARGRKGGRPPKMTPERIQLARQMYESEQYDVSAIAKNLGVSRPTIYKHLNHETRL
ncbi:DNA invertase Pin-like site-specific DNA recombinase [Jatrophihabitans sp. GAS493]|uniref:recombinase family protein n=1 Tax=Jatrophihabitans sp. GAS493 TaxID=1907575 RepID=UPI000BB9955F|nr:recombinase family protein [Jatrophihabitans sp. GAS493]SOD72903.1 DNA invertase Pin-like site-specific DNA recombinase [Jatrophihabitans sp. GAS493]